jgi:peroxiredoxin 2/4
MAEAKWAVMFSHPADFTPVCTAEIMEFAGVADEVKSLNVQLVGLSNDRVHSHLALIKNVKEKMGVDIPFPIIADLDMAMAKKYGMIHSGQRFTATIKTVFFIDYKGILRAMIYYPLTNWEIFSGDYILVKALQTTDKYSVATQANWQPGDMVVVRAPKNKAEMDKRLLLGYECKDWHLCFQKDMIFLFFGKDI